ncbi:HK97 family phage prohead protease [Pseudotamlana carrageenivorans]|uniref:Caudovirus prohead protease n=1 Tax=Pseudotamlana carrageenivorans TaxID=2069432 RepID=A0A2I7SF33_9FLAO|nr:HK97 family phage prohead protease [Tamlana carrageenivorans]AUS04494.1 caudovirus prohead protease [Tamlana carrageenivorans]
MPKTRFVFNDEAQKNSYGFFIPTSGIDLTRFTKNPIMLDSHINSTRAVIGMWEDFKADKGILSGLPVFDSEDESAAVIAGKVERGFIKSCSMGVRFNRDDLKFVAGELVLEKCELYEVSIVAVPSNANAIRLYVDDSDTPLSEQEIQNLCLAVQPVTGAEVIPPTLNNLNTDMKITLTSAAALALGFAATELEHEAEAISQKVVTLEAAKKSAELKYNALKQAEEAKALEGIKNKVQLAHKAGKINADKIDEFVNLGIANESLLDSTLEAIPAKASLSAQVTGGEAGSGEVKTVEDFMKLGHEAQLAFKADQPETYKQLFTPKQ